MPRGFSAIVAATKKQGGVSSNVLFFKLPGDGDSATVRFLEEGDEVYGYWYHDFTSLNKKEGWKTKIACLDQEDEGTACPGCEEDLPRKFEGLINLIWRNAPLYERDDDGTINWDKKKGTADQVAVWRSGVTIFRDTLPKKDFTFKGLASRDFEVERSGTGMRDTSYSVEPVVIDGETKKTPLSKADKALDEGKYDLDELARIPEDYDQARERVNEAIAKYTGADDDDVEDDDISEFLKDSPFSDD